MVEPKGTWQGIPEMACSMILLNSEAAKAVIQCGEADEVVIQTNESVACVWNGCRKM